MTFPRSILTLLLWGPLTACDGDKNSDSAVDPQDTDPTEDSGDENDTSTHSDDTSTQDSGTDDSGSEDSGNSDSGNTDTGSDVEPFTCEVTQPFSGSIQAPDTKISLMGQIAHTTADLDTIVVSWTGNGTELGTSTVDGKGNVAFTTSPMPLGDYEVTMLATDESGETCSASTEFTIGMAPEIEVWRPISGDFVDYEDPVSFSTRLVDDGPLEELSVTWESDNDGLISTDTPNEEGLIEFSISTLSLGQHMLTVTATDGQGIETAQTIILFVIED